MKSPCYLIWCNSAFNTKPNRINIPYHLTRLYEVADYLQKQNVLVKCFDMEMWVNEYTDLCESVIRENASCFVFYTTTENLPIVIKYSEMLKTINQNCKIMVYGEISAIAPDYFLDYNIDATASIKSDPEISIKSFYDYVFSGDSSKLIGVNLIKNKQLVLSQNDKWLNPAEWGVPDKKWFSYEDVLKSGRINQMTLTITKGCSFPCDYCITKVTEGIVYRKRPIEQIINFIKNHSYSTYKFFSAFFTLDKEYVASLCRELIKLDKKISWSCCTRADFLQDEELVSLMKQAGCYKVSIGVETLSQTNLNFINKKLEIEQINNSLKLLNKYHITFKALLMFGIPNQTKEDIKATLDILTQYDNVVLRPLAYSQLFDIKRGMSPFEVVKYDKWTNYDFPIEGISRELFFKLLYDVNNYKKYI